MDSHACASVSSHVFVGHVCRFIDFVHASLDTQRAQCLGCLRSSRSECHPDSLHVPRACSPLQKWPTDRSLNESHDAAQHRDFLQVTFVWTKYSTDFHDQCLVQFCCEPLQIVIICQSRSRHVIFCFRPDRLCVTKNTEARRSPGRSVNKLSRSRARLCWRLCWCQFHECSKNRPRICTQTNETPPHRRQDTQPDRRAHARA